MGASLFYCGEFGPEHTDSYTLDFDPTDGIDWHTTHTDRGTGDAFLTMLQLEDGMVNYGWTRTWGGTSYDAALDVDSDGDGNWVVGQFDGACDFNQDGNSEWRYSNGFGDVFVMRLSAAGEFLWVSTFGGDDDDEPFDVRVSSAGDGYVLGEFYGSVDFDPGPGEDYHTGRGGSDVFLSKYSSDGTYLWTRTLEPNRSPSGYRLEINREGELLIGGFFEDTMDVDPGAGELLLTARGDLDGLVSVWTPDGEHVWSRQIGGEGSRVAVGSAVFDDGGSVIAVGTFSGDLDFNDAGPPDVHASRGGRDAFMTRFSPEGEYEWTVTWGGLGEEDAATHATAHENGDITVAGLFQGTVDFDPGPGVTELTAVGNRDMFLLRFTCPQECPELLKHRASGGAGVAKSK
ncbi:MAG: hypothetical protein IT449_05580, partial [Phycisphaerales bacterium]|nr:hypothetical protein [Phycisphaerales bacterium]